MHHQSCYSLQSLLPSCIQESLLQNGTSNIQGAYQKHHAHFDKKWGISRKLCMGQTSGTEYICYSQDSVTPGTVVLDRSFCFKHMFIHWFCVIKTQLLWQLDVCIYGNKLIGKVCSGSIFREVTGLLTVMSGFCLDVDEICALLGYGV